MTRDSAKDKSKDNSYRDKNTIYFFINFSIYLTVRYIWGLETGISINFEIIRSQREAPLEFEEFAIIKLQLQRHLFKHLEFKKSDFILVSKFWSLVVIS